MRVSVIIPTHNRAHALQRAIDSVLRQTAPAFEVIVVDDGSTDDTGRVLRKFPQVRVVRRQENRGVAAARNAGISSAAGNWFAFLDSDDEWLPGKLEAQRAYHRENPETLISQTDEIWVRNGVRVNPGARHKKLGGCIFKEGIRLCLVSPSAVIIHRSVMENVGLFDEGMPVCEDYDLWLRVAKRYPIGYLPRRLIVKYGGHADQLSRRYWGMDRWRVEALEKHLNDPDGFSPAYDEAEIREHLFRAVISKSEILAKGAYKRNNTFIYECYNSKLKVYREYFNRFLNNKGGRRVPEENLAHGQTCVN